MKASIRLIPSHLFQRANPDVRGTISIFPTQTHFGKLLQGMAQTEIKRGGMCGLCKMWRTSRQYQERATWTTTYGQIVNNEIKLPMDFSYPRWIMEAPNFWFSLLWTGIEKFSLYCRQSWNSRSTCLCTHQLLLKLNVCKLDTTCCVCSADTNLQP